MQKNKFLVQLATLLATNKKQIVYVAGKVTGLPTDEVQAKFKRAKDMLEDQGYLVLNPCEFIESDADWHLAMRMATTLLCMSDHIFMLRDWEDSRGAKCEFDIAKEFEINIMWEQQRPRNVNVN